jgi:hypothetical protein
MSVGILEINDHETMEKDQKQEGEVPGVKRGRTKKCRVCGMGTYQKEGLCVLCKTGIREAAEALTAS